MRVALVVLGLVCLVGMVVSYVFTPETMGRSLEENENEDEDDEEQLCSGCFAGASGRSDSAEVIAI